MTEDQKDIAKIVGLGIAALAIIGVLLVGIHAKQTKCEAKGGVLVRATFERVCIKADVIEMD